MQIKEEKVLLRDGREIVLRSPEGEDAETCIECMKEIYTEAKYLTTYSDEFTVTLHEEIDYIEEYLYNKEDFLLGAFDGDTMIGNMNITKRRENSKKTGHRATLGIAIKEEYCGSGLGTIMFEKALSVAKENGFEQIELEVFSKNERAQNLYKKMGFKEVGRIPNAIKDKDGTYMDELIMILKF